MPAERLTASSVSAIATHLARRLLRERLLLLYVLFDLACALGFGSRWYWQILVDYLLLLPLYVLVIRVWTRHDRPIAIDDITPIAPWRDAIVFGVPVIVIAGLSIWAWQNPIPIPATLVPAAPPLAVDPWNVLAMKADNALASALMQLVPAVLLCIVATMTPHALGLRPRYLGLGAALIVFGIAIALVLAALGVPLDIPLVTMPAFALPIFALQIFINGFPEELLNRGLLMQRLITVLRSPANAIVVSSIVFGAMHIPIQMLRRGDSDVVDVLLTNLGGQPTGLVWAYLFYRTRSLWPGILWHTSFTTLGVLFL